MLFLLDTNHNLHKMRISLVTIKKLQLLLLLTKAVEQPIQTVYTGPESILCCVHTYSQGVSQNERVPY
jgi:hypothetical protein